eukprot:snap_masked-scaffold_17-processed-gene-3.19-mRNA-1 protein AED:1.00 eAED:1.00 QI:0/0/0/0/1/1/2/0/59
MGGMLYVALQQVLLLVLGKIELLHQNRVDFCTLPENDTQSMAVKEPDQLQWANSVEQNE